MVLDKQRDKIDPILTKFARYFSFIHPNLLSLLSLIFAIISGIFFYFSTGENLFLYFASFFVLLNGFFDAIDGKVAKLTKKASRKGDFIDHTIDRYSDVFILGGITLSIWCNPIIGFFAIVGMLLTSYMGTQAQAVGFRREYSGLLGRADRLALLIIIPVAQQILLENGYAKFFGFYLLEIMLIYFAIVGNITAIQRFIITMRWLNKKD